MWDKSECVCGVTRLSNVRHIKHTHWLTHSRRASTQRSQALFCSPPPRSHSLAQCFLSFPLFPPIIPHAHLRITSAKRWKLPLISNLTFSRYRSGWVYPSHASVPTKPFITEEFLKTAPVSNSWDQNLIHPLTASKKTLMGHASTFNPYWTFSKRSHLGCLRSFLTRKSKSVALGNEKNIKCLLKCYTTNVLEVVPIKSCTFFFFF